MSCDKCRKKTIITFNCRCEKIFCSKCRYPEVHGCTYDYKTAGKDKIKINNPLVINNKIDKI